MKIRRYFLVLSLLVISVGSVCSEVKWATDGVAICTAANVQNNQAQISDGTGGAIITWNDIRDGACWHIYAQRVDANGSIHTGWPADGAVICAAADNQVYPTVVSDGAGGAIITWKDYRNGNWDIYAQRIDANGSIHTGWTVNGMVICTESHEQDVPTIASDEAGGAIITWKDYRNGNWDIYAQRIDANGSIHAGWTANGVAICTAASTQYGPILISDGAGGAIITWDSGVTCTISVQRVDSTGSVKWIADGVTICADTNQQNNIALISDGAGGTIITWYDYRNGNWDIFAQHVDSTGSVKWTANGVAICTNTNNQYSPTLVSDGAGGAIITWRDYRNDGGSTSDIYAQRVNSAGVVQWLADGVAICNAADYQTNSTIASDGAGGAIITWEDNRNGNYDIYAQRIDANGSIHAGWTADGVAICTENTNDQNNPSIASDGAGGAIIVWKDYRSGNYDLYAQRIYDAAPVVPPPSTSSTSSTTNVTAGADTLLTATGTKGDVTVAITANTFTTNLSVTVTADPTLPAVPAAQTGFTGTNVGVEITLSDEALVLKKPVTVTVGYRASDIAGLTAGNLALCFYNTTSGKWIPLHSVVDETGRTVRATVSHFTLFQIMQVAAAVTLNDAKAYPNPFLGGVNTSINFLKLTAGAAVTVYTLRGEKVAQLTADNAGLAVWDGKAANGNLVGPGIYLALINDGTNKKTIKLAVER